jgi:hypothetical protein
LNPWKTNPMKRLLNSDSALSDNHQPSPGRRIDGTNQIKQGGLAGPGRAPDRHKIVL